MKILYNKEYDNQGLVGAMGTLNKTLLQFLIQEDSFITINPPKSSGQEVHNGLLFLHTRMMVFVFQYYSNDYIEKVLKQSRSLELKNEDIINTVTGNNIIKSRRTQCQA